MWWKFVLAVYVGVVMGRWLSKPVIDFINADDEFSVLGTYENAASGEGFFSCAVSFILHPDLSSVLFLLIPVVAVYELGYGNPVAVVFTLLGIPVVLRLLGESVPY